jgi:integrase/recombinase XerD
MTASGETGCVGVPSVSLTRANGQVVGAVSTCPLVEHFLSVIKVNRAANTWLSYSYDLKGFFGIVQKCPRLLGRNDCIDYVLRQKTAGKASSTTNRTLAAVSSLWQELALAFPHDFEANPINPLPKRGMSMSIHRKQSRSLYAPDRESIPKIVPGRDLEQLLLRFPRWRDRAIVMLMTTSCLRVSEVVALELADIDCDRLSVNIRAGKGNKDRVTFMDGNCFTVLNRYLDLERSKVFATTNRVFVALQGKTAGQSLRRNTIEKSVAYYSDKLGLDFLHPHIFRHTGITRLLEAGMPDAVVRDLIGHNDPRSLEPYLHLGDKFVQREFERAEQRFDPDYGEQL